MKQIRDGYEDYEYLQFLRDNGKGAEATTVARALFPAVYDTARSDAQIQAARSSLGTLVAGIVGEPAP